ncbi:hypothetical protein JHL22_15290 [Advenella sp. WQ 585]|uniref:Uncharacterized protein n=1 Tax=Advenella mandrilli TaxID=2800330 RepID=A0ABS1EHW4_9BURK|nr:CopG family transcriptional regulator [Advenella mandrilli]MBK1782576.1 hypothetical protein [Advenella mandrilli]
MEMRYNDQLAKLLPDWHIGPRTELFLWLLLKKSNYYDVVFDFEIHDIRNRLAEYIESHGLVNAILLYSKNFLPEEDFNWIEKNGYQPNWLLRNVKNRIWAFLPTLDYLTPKEKIIGLFDLWNENMITKRSSLNVLKEEWAQQERIINDFSWYTSTGKEKQKCQVAWEWYIQNNSFFLNKPLQFSKLEDILDFLDGTNFTHTEKLYHLEQIKKKFKALQTKANRQGKKQTNISLSEESRQQLEELATQGGRTKTEVIEILIRKAHENGMPI